MSGRTFEKFELIKRVLAHGRFVVHGSNQDDLRWVEPRALKGAGPGDEIKAVCGTEDVATAIFHAVLDRRRVEWSCVRDGVYAIEPAEGSSAPWLPGAVYVLDRSDFERVDGHWLSRAAVRAVGKVAVTIEDFPQLEEVRLTTRQQWLAAGNPE